MMKRILLIAIVSLSLAGCVGITMNTKAWHTDPSPDTEQDYTHWSHIQRLRIGMTMQEASEVIELGWHKHDRHYMTLYTWREGKLYEVALRFSVPGRDADGTRTVDGRLRPAKRSATHR